MLDFLKDNLRGFIESDGLSSFASRAKNSRGRIYNEAPSKTRNDFERDRDRIIYSEAFRKLKFKTQVFIYHEGDNYRTRLSHSMEVAQIARYLARMLKANEDLAETSALGHDLGHTPFAHVGERALKEAMKDYGGFDHNDQTLRVVSRIENKYPNFRGLNLTWESLESFAKHNGAIKGGISSKIALKEISTQRDFMLDKHASIEAQIAGISDDIAYNSHDIEDGLYSGLFTLDDLCKVDWVKEIIEAKKSALPNIESYILNQEVIREVMGMFSQNVLEESVKRLVTYKPNSPDDIRNAKEELIAMSPDMLEKSKILKKFLADAFYFHPYVNKTSEKMEEIVKKLFAVYMEDSKNMPEYWQKELDFKPKEFNNSQQCWQARVVADYIASMTDRSAILKYKEFFGEDDNLLGN